MTPRIETLNHCHVLEEKGFLFKSEDTQATEDEYLHLLHALVYSLKPESILETGSYKGMGTAFMAKALKRNAESQSYIPHKGHIYSVEIAASAASWAEEQLRVNGVSDYGTIIRADSVEYLSETNRRFDFAFFDSELRLRSRELRLCLARDLILPGTFFAMHDTSRLRTTTPGEHDTAADEFWDDFSTVEGIKFLEFPLSRGLVLGQVL